MTPDAQQCERILAAAADAAARYGAITVSITLLTERGYHLWQHTGQPPAALVELAAQPVVGGEQ